MPQFTFHHIHLMSPDPEQTAAFYQKVFNAKLVSRQPLPDGRTTIELSLDGAGSGKRAIWWPMGCASFAIGSRSQGAYQIGLLYARS